MRDASDWVLRDRHLRRKRQARDGERPRLQNQLDASGSAHSHSLFLPPTMIFSRLTLGFLLVTLAAFFCAQSVEAKGPRITHKVYFDIKHGDKDLGRGTYCYLPLHGLGGTSLADIRLAVVLGLYGGVRV